MEGHQNNQSEHTNQIKIQEKICSFCKIQKPNLDRCGRCKKDYYCGVQCQKKHYPQHKKQCKPPPSIKPKQIELVGIDEFKNLEYVGSGNFSEIFRGVSKKNEQIYAIKQIDKSKLRRVQKQADVLMEKHCLKKLKGWQYAVQIQKTFQDQLNLYIQMQYPANGELWNQCRTFGFISQSLVKYYFSHIVYAISQLHNEFSIVHRDLKPQNILLTKSNNIKLIDFGTAKDLSRPDLKGSGNGSKRRKVFQNFIGTPNYMAPECINNKASEKASDIYSLAGVFYFLKSGSPPFTGGSQYLIFNKSLNNNVYLPEDIFNKVQADLIEKMMEKKMDLRITMDEVMKHQYFKDINFKELPSYEMIEKNITSQQKYLIEIKSHLQKFSNSYSQPLNTRIKIYEQQIKLILQAAKNKIPENLNKQFIIKKVKLIHIDIYSMLNILDDTNKGFQEIHKQLINQDL